MAKSAPQTLGLEHGLGAQSLYCSIGAWRNVLTADRKVMSSFHVAFILALMTTVQFNRPCFRVKSCDRSCNRCCRMQRPCPKNTKLRSFHMTAHRRVHRSTATGSQSETPVQRHGPNGSRQPWGCRGRAPCLGCFRRRIESGIRHPIRSDRPEA